MTTKDLLGGKPIPACPKDDFDMFGALKEEKAKANQMEIFYK